jgi:hypothetical protein
MISIDLIDGSDRNIKYGNAVRFNPENGMVEILDEKGKRMDELPRERIAAVHFIEEEG